MALGARELLLIIRARDEASRVMRHLSGSMRDMDKDAKRAARANLARGEALTSMGAGIAAVGAAGLIFLGKSIQASIEYNRQAALTQTQLDRTKGSLEDIKGIGIAVAKEIPVPFETVQKSLYDIFSSMDVNISGARILLRGFAKAAVAGQTDIQVAGRATIGIMNAYGLKAKQVHRINDVMFQLVRKGVGTYEQFATTIGRAVPSAVRAGQSIEELAGMLAFLTRNGLSTAMAAASAGRALDAFSNPTVVKRLGQMGINAKNAAGEFRPISDVMTELGRKMSKLTAPERAAALKELFKGAGGTIQARRFFDVALRQYGELNQRVDEMKRSSGSLKNAYDIMFKQPQSQVQLLTNRFKIMAVTIGDALMPAFMAIVGVISGVINWFNNLSPTTKKWIAIGLALTAVLLVVTGALIAVIGAILMFSAVMALATVTIGGILTVIGIVIAAIVALAVIVFLVVKYHEQIWAFIQMVWDQILQFFVGIWHAIYNVFMTAWDAIWAFVKGAIEAGVAFIQAVWNNEVVQFFVAVYTTLFEIWRQFWLTVFTLVKTVLGIIINFIRNVWTAVTTWLAARWQTLVGIAQTIWHGIKRNIIEPMQAVADLIMTKIIGPLINWLNERWQRFKETVGVAWDAIKKAIIEPIREAVEAVRGFIEDLTNKITSFRDKVVGIAQGIRDALNHLNPLNRDSPSLVENVERGFTELDHVFSRHLGRMSDMATRVAGGFSSDLANMAMSGVGGSGASVYQELTVYTNEIDPRKHSAEMGWELANRVG